MGFLESLWEGTIGGLAESTLDSLGASRHGRDQVVNQENALEQMRVQNQYAVENWQNQFKQTNEEFDRRYNLYQSPRALVRQYNEAGLNPAVALSGGSAGFGGVGSAVNPSSVPISHGSVVGHGSVSDSRPSDYIDALSRLKLSEAQSTEIFELLKGKLRQQDDAHDMQSALLFAQRWQNEMNNLYGSEERARKLTNLVYEGISLLMQGKESEAGYKFIEAKTTLAHDEHLKNKEELPRVGLQLDALIGMWKKMGGYYQSAGAYQSAQAQTENDLREFRSTILNNEAQLSSDTLQSKIDEIINQSKASDVLPENARIALEIAKKENNLYYARAILGMVTDAISTVLTVRTGGRIANAMEVRNDIQKRVQDYNETNGVTEKVTDTFDKKGHIKSRVHSYQRQRGSKR